MLARLTHELFYYVFFSVFIIKLFFMVSLIHGAQVVFNFLYCSFVDVSQSANLYLHAFCFVEFFVY